MDSHTHEESLPTVDTTHEQDVQHLFQAIRKGKTHLTKFMLAASNNSLLNCWSNEGRTPLIECCYIREELTRGIMVRLLKDAGADVNMKDKSGKTSLIHACEQRCNDVVKILIQHANISPDVEDVDGNTALIHSAYIGNDVALELLVKNFRRLGLNIDHYNKAGYTALHVATTKGFIQCAKILTVKGKASVTLKDKVHRLTPLEWCLRMGFQKSELEFLKPAAKFYKVAKLTTTMVKCRKKSEQELPICPKSPRRSPTRTTEKPKFKVRSLLNKAKTPSSEETGSISVGTMGKQASQPTKTKTNEKNAMSKFIAKSKSNFLSKSKYKHILGKTRQRSLSQSDQSEEVQAVAIATTGLTHSRSHPVTSVCLLAITSECSSEGEISQENIQEFITLPGEFGECDTDDLDSCKLDIDSDYLSAVIAHQKVITFGHDRVYCGEIDSCSSTLNTVSPVSYEEGRGYSGTSSSNSNDSPARYGRHGLDTPGNIGGLYASGESSYSEQSIRSCTESTASSSNSFYGKDEADVSDTSGDDSSEISSDETHTTVIDKNAHHNQGELSASKQVKHSSKSKQNIKRIVKHKTDIPNTTKRPISETDFDTVSQQTEIEYLEETNNTAHSQDMSLQMTFSNSGRNQFYGSNSKELHNSSNRQSLFTKEMLESQNTDRNLNSPETEIEYMERILESPSADRNMMSPQTEIEFVDDDNSSQFLEMSRSSRGEKLNSASQSNSSKSGNAQSTKRDNNNTTKVNAIPEDRANNFQKNAVSGRECVYKRAGITREDLSSPQTEIMYIDMVTPDNVLKDIGLEYLDNPKIHEKTKTDQKFTPLKAEFVNKINHATRHDVISPQTEIEYIDLCTPDYTTENSIPEIFDPHKKRRDASEAKTKPIQNVILQRDTFHDGIKHIRTTQISPHTELDYIDLQTSNEWAENNDDECSEETKASLDGDDDDDFSEDVSDTAVGQFTVRKSLHDFTENVMSLVELATSQGFVVESKNDTKSQAEPEEADQSSCDGSSTSSGVETLIDNLENDLSYLSVDSLFPSINGEITDFEKEGNETC